MLSATSNISWTKKHSLLSKWNILFDKSPEWISFKPQLGLKVFPCYACKNMFSSKLTFQDHINRRVIIIKFKCVNCTNTFTFYNRCSFLLHCRKHFAMNEGHVNLANVDILMLPVDLAGFSRHENIPFLYDEEEEYVDRGTYINCQFYTPDDSEAGKQIIALRPFNLVFHYSEASKNVLLVLKQITSNVPLCEFVTQGFEKPAKTVEKEVPTIVEVEPEIKQEVEEADEFTIPVISKIESLNQLNVKKCTECGVVQEKSLAAHILGNNKPLDETIICQVCKYVAPTKCSLKAHVRTHDNSPPFVCPECGKIFKSSDFLSTHMEDVCFHVTKQVRFRCPAQKCGKLFVLPNTYASHFANHMQCINKCSECGSSFFNESDFSEHSKTHNASTPIKIFNCLVCKNISTMSEEKSTEHINWHLQDRERCVYIYTCRFCRSYFRSTATYSVHKLRCRQADKIQPAITISPCQFCGQKLQFREKDNFKTCTTCKQINLCKGKSNVQDKSACMLCKEDLTPENKEAHMKMCKYNNPRVNIRTLSNETKDSDETSSSEKLSDAESKPSTFDSSNDSLKQDEVPKNKKRKRPSSSSTKIKKLATSSEDSIDLQADKPVSFDGTYYCKLCDYKSADRGGFHCHIVEHRDVSTAYQCMECGECFVVKPSLIKHLTHYHKITDTSQYLASNECYDKDAIEKLESQLKMVPREHEGPVKENQCTVCLEQFEDPLTLSKHFRMHGMAFLLKKAK